MKLKLSHYLIAVAMVGASATSIAQNQGLLNASNPIIDNKMNAADYPPNAKAGECYARIVHPQYGSEEYRFQAMPAYTEYNVTPAEFSSKTNTVDVYPAHYTYTVTPPEFKDVTETVLVSPEKSHTEVVPATFKKGATHKRLIAPAQKVWKRSGDLSAAERATQNLSADAGDDIMCLVETPAIYEEVNELILDTPASTRLVVDQPAVYKKLVRKVLTKKATSRKVNVNSKTGSYTQERLARKEIVRTNNLPNSYDQGAREVVVGTDTEWRSILCDNNSTPAVIKNLQKKLSSAGFDAGSSDGKVSDQTLKAVRDYQAKNGLPVDQGRYINMTTIESLGLYIPRK